MANNFRIVGDYYVSKEGSDANSGLTPDLPKLTINAAVTAATGTKIIVIGSGVYRETWSQNIGSKLLTLIGDGATVIEGLGYDSLVITGISGGQLVFRNIEIRNFALFQVQSILNGQVYFYDSILSIPFSADSAGGSNLVVLTRCKIINSVVRILNGSSNNGVYLDKCVCINSTFGSILYILCAVQQVLNSYIDATSVVISSSGITAANFNYNNIQGKVVMNTGTYIGVALSYADHRTYYPTFNVNSMSVAPLFNNVQNLDFTLQSTSPHIRAANDFQTNIGGTEYAKHYEATSTEFTSGATITDLTLQSDGYVITAPATEGRIITAPLAVQAYPATKPLTGIIWNGNLEFNKSITGGLTGNQQVPAYDTYTSGAGATPDRLKIKMRYSTQSASPTAGQWDNGGYWTVDTYQLVEVNVKPKVDSNGVGNGSYTYIEFVGLGDLSPTWIQLDIKLRNDYNI